MKVGNFFYELFIKIRLMVQKLQLFFGELHMQIVHQCRVTYDILQKEVQNFASILMIFKFENIRTCWMQNLLAYC